MLYQTIPTKIFYALSILFLLKLVCVVSFEMFDGAMEFTYGDNDQLGPSHWKSNKGVAGKTEGSLFGRSLKGKTSLRREDINVYERNRCKSSWLSPININSRSVNAPDLDRAAAKNAAGARNLGGKDIPETLVISLTHKNIEKELWELGHPADDLYNGIEIRPPSFGMLNVMDYFDPLDKTNPSAIFNFKFLTLFYCDLKTAPPHRSMHQIDGKRFPLELHFVFTRRLRRRHGDADYGSKLEDDGNELSDDDDPNPDLIGGDSITVIVVVHGEVGSKQNKYFQPVAEAAQKFLGKDFGVDEIDDSAVVAISSPWSVTWLLPDNSDYYYYDDGSFPVPPCWKVTRYYIFIERIQISQSQLDALTNIQTEREKESGNKLPCTFSLLRHELLSGEVTVNLMDYEFRGNDNKPRTPEEARLWRIRRKKMQDYRKRLEGKLLLIDKSNDGDGRSMCRKIWFDIRLVLILIILLTTQ